MRRTIVVVVLALSTMAMLVSEANAVEAPMADEYSNRLAAAREIGSGNTVLQATVSISHGYC